MNHDRPYLLVDTNIWLDYFIPERANHKLVLQFIQKAIEADAELLYAAISAKDIYYQFAKDRKMKARLENNGTLSPEDSHTINVIAEAVIKNLSQIATGVACDSSDIWLAQKYCTQHSDFEDNFIVTAAQRAKADYLVTNDEKLLRHCPVASADVIDAITFINANRRNDAVN